MAIVPLLGDGVVTDAAAPVSLRIAPGGRHARGIFVASLARRLPLCMTLPQALPLQRSRAWLLTFPIDIDEHG